ncbi:MAG: sugar ABC transporter permease [Lachnospiraceae bacterium]|nr:sugar ABC transporter permease [Lachnospiraceae bacterium]
MDNQTEATVVSVKKQWWLKVNTKALRFGPLDGATFPHIIKVKYTVDGTEYTKRAWIGAGKPVPEVGSTVSVKYCSEKPSKAKVM